MVFPAIVRRVSKSMSAILQGLAIICLIHYVILGISTKVHKYNQKQYGQAILSTTSSHSGGVRAGGHRSRRPHITRTTTTTSTTTPQPPQPDHVMEEEQKRRLDVLHKACTRWNVGLWTSENASNITMDEKIALATVPTTPLYQKLIVSEEHHLAVCPAARTGVQWLARRLLALTGKFDEQQLLRLKEPPAVIVKHNFPYLSSWEKYPIVLAQSVTILMARHPLDRLLASYRQTLEDAVKNPSGYLHYGRRIVNRYRKSPVHSKGPTFEEFIRYLLEHDSRHVEEAWHSTTIHCTPCHIPYNMVVHYETLWHDVQWAWKKAGLEALNTTDYIVNRLTPEIRRQYFSELTLSQVLGLYKKYRLDFQMFGYTLEEHMAYAKPGEEALDPVLMAELPRTNQDHLQNLLKEAQERAQLKNDQEDSIKEELENSIKEVLKAPSAMASPSLSLTGVRGPSPMVNNDIGPVEDYRQPPLRATGP